MRKPGRQLKKAWRSWRAHGSTMSLRAFAKQAAKTSDSEHVSGYWLVEKAMQRYVRRYSRKSRVKKAQASRGWESTT